MTGTRRVAISGLGSIGRQHARAFGGLQGVEVVGFDPTPDSRATAVESGLVADAYETFEELLDAEPRALVIATPDSFHLPQLQAAVARAVPTLVEKPIADSLDTARRIVPTVEAAGTEVLVGYVLRHRQIVETARRLLTDGAIGVPTSFQVMLGAYATIKAAASRFSTSEPNRLYRDYSHEWDYLRWIFGPIEEVLAVARTNHDVPHVESPNLVDGLISTRDGVVGAFHIDYVDQHGGRTLTVIGTEGSLVADIAVGTITVRRVGDDERVLRRNEPAAAILTRQAEHLLAVAEGAEPPRVTLQDGLAALEVTDALIRSARSRSWVALN